VTGPPAGTGGESDPAGILFRFHPWHGVPLGEKYPEKINVYIEIVPTDTMKFELDKVSGILKIDRPQRFSNHCPAPYGFIPRTLCARRVAEFCMEKTGRTGIIGDGDPLDICVLTESNINHGNVLLTANPIGGLRMLDGNEADDKILAVLEGDLAFEGVKGISDLPAKLVDRLRHYFLTYKDIPGQETHQTEITHVFDREDAFEIMRRSREDYENAFASLVSHHQNLIRLVDQATERAIGHSRE
jgi:inorganic pyrophosphatase